MSITKEYVSMTKKHVSIIKHDVSISKAFNVSDFTTCYVNKIQWKWQWCFFFEYPEKTNGIFWKQAVTNSDSYLGSKWYCDMSLKLTNYGRRQKPVVEGFTECFYWDVTSSRWTYRNSIFAVSLWHVQWGFIYMRSRKKEIVSRCYSLSAFVKCNIKQLNRWAQNTC